MHRVNSRGRVTEQEESSWPSPVQPRARQAEGQLPKHGFGDSAGGCAGSAVFCATSASFSGAAHVFSSSGAAVRGSWRPPPVAGGLCAAGLRRSPSGSYPPPLVRLAVARQVAVQGGFPTGSQVFSDDLPAPPTLAGTPAGLRPLAGAADAPDRARRLLGAAPAVASALLGLEAGAGRGLRVLGTVAARAYGDGTIAGWRKELLGDGEPVGEQTLDAARIVAAAAVEAWQRAGAAGLAAPGPAGDAWASAATRLAGRVLAVLPECSEPGTRAAGGVPDPAGLAGQILADLDAKAGAG